MTSHGGSPGQAPESPEGQSLSHRVGLCQAALFCSKGFCPLGRAGRTVDLEATQMEPSWQLSGRHTGWESCTLHKAHSALVKMKAAVKPDINHPKQY